MADGLKMVMFVSACVSIMLMLWTTALPQNGDAAIGTFMVFLAALAAYALTLALAVPLAVRSIARHEALIEKRFIGIAIVAPVVVGALVVFWTEVLR